MTNSEWVMQDPWLLELDNGAIIVLEPKVSEAGNQIWFQKTEKSKPQDVIGPNGEEMVMYITISVMKKREYKPYRKAA